MIKNLLLIGALLAGTMSISAADPVSISPSSGSDISAILNLITGGKTVGDVTINLAKNGEYTVSGPIKTPAGLTINGNGATIDASGLDTTFILMSEKPTVEMINDYYRVGAVTINNVNVTGLGYSIFYDNNTKYCVVDFSINNSTFDLTTKKVENEALISLKAGGIKDFTIKNSTVYGNNAVAKYFIRYNNSARLDRYGYDTATDFQSMTYLNNTFYGLLKSDGQWGNYNGIQSQKYSKFNVQKNIWYNCGKDIIRRVAGGRFNGSNPMEFAYNTYFNDGVSIAESESSYDNSTTILETNPDFADPAEGNFTIGAGTQQAKFKTGAPKWLVEYNAAESVPANLTVAPASGENINTAIAAAMGTWDRLGNLTLNLEKDGAYTVTGSIEVGGGVTINGNGATIDASALETPFILMSKNPAVEAINDYYRVNAVSIDGVTVTGLPTSIFYDNNVKYCVVDFSITNSTLALATTAVSNEALVAFQGGGAKDFTVKNSTIYGNNAVAKYFVRYNNSARLDRYGYDKETEFQVMTYLDNTFYGLLKSDGQWGNYSAIQGQNYIKFDVHKNIWYNCGQDIIRRMAGGRFGGNAPKEFAYNTYFNDGVNIGASEASYDNSATILETNPGFADAAAGNFTIGAGTQQAKYQTGAPKWLVEYNAAEAVPVSITVAPATGADITAAVATAKESVDKVGNIIINLEKDGAYTVSGSIEVPAAVTINGNGATVDASALKAPFVLMSATPAVAAGETEFYTVDNISFNNVNVTGLTQQLIYGNKVKYYIPSLITDGSQIQLAGGNKTVYDFNGGGVVGTLDIKNSTINSTPANTGALFSTQSGNRVTDVDPDLTQTLSIKNSTLYNIANGKNTCSNRANGQKWQTYIVKDNVIIGCGKKDQFVVGLNGGQQSGNPTWEVDNNSFLWETDGVFEVSSEKEPVSGKETITNSVGEPTSTFPEAAEGIFTLDASSAQAKAQVGAPKWLVEYVPAPEGVAFTVEGYGRYTWGNTYDDYETPFEFDADNKTVTFQNFLGGTTTVELQFELADPNKDPDMTGTKFNAVPVSGLGEPETISGYKGCSINDFTGSLILKQDGVNACKLDNVMLYIGYASQIDIMMDNGAKVYNFTIMLGGDYSSWDAETSSWKSTGTSETIHLVKNVPFDNGSSALDSIEVEDTDAPVEYYNLQGIRVENPSNGIYIRRQGKSVRKVVIK